MCGCGVCSYQPVSALSYWPPLEGWMHEKRLSGAAGNFSTCCPGVVCRETSTAASSSSPQQPEAAPGIPLVSRESTEGARGEEDILSAWMGRGSEGSSLPPRPRLPPLPLPPPEEAESSQEQRPVDSDMDTEWERPVDESHMGLDMDEILPLFLMRRLDAGGVNTMLDILTPSVRREFDDIPCIEPPLVEYSGHISQATIKGCNFMGPHGELRFQFLFFCGPFLAVCFTNRHSMLLLFQVFSEWMR